MRIQFATSESFQRKKTAMRSFKHALRLLGLAAGLFVSLLALPLPSSAQVSHTPPLAPILNTKIFVQGNSPSAFEYVDFTAPKAGNAVLRAVDGAQVGATKREQIQGVEITLNGKTVISGRKAFERTTSVLEFWVSLRQGPNRLGVRLPSKRPSDPGKPLSVRIDAPADKIVLTPVLTSVVVGRDPLLAQATVTGLGMPVPDADVIFEIRGLGADIEQRAATGDAGIATAYIRGFNEGEGMLRAKVTDLLVSEIPIKAVVKPAIVLEESPTYLKLEAGSERILPLTVNVLKVNSPGNRVMLQHIIEPDSDGLVIDGDYPIGGYQVDAPQTIQANPTVNAYTPGSYTVTTIATIAETGDSDSHELSVEVVEPDTPDPLILFNPSADPSGIPIGPASTTVTFRAVVGGTLTPPDVLYLDEVDAEGTLLFEDVAELQRDNENYIYTGTLAIPSKVAAEKYFRVRAWYFNKFVTSGISTVGVTPFPLDARPSDPDTLVNDPAQDSRLFSNEVIIRVRPGVSSNPERIEYIAQKAGGIVVGVIPSARKYLLEIRGDETVARVQKAIETLLTFAEVAEAYPNYEVVEEATPSEAPNGCTTDTGNCQWYIEHVGIKQAWEKAGGGSSTIPVVVLESSGIDASHSDIGDQCKAEGGNNPCVANGQHGTWVAGVIGAKANNGGIAGVAWNTQLLSYKFDNSSFKLAAALSKVGSGKRIINMSLTNQGGLDKEVRDAINNGALIVAAAGNVGINNDGSCSNSDDKYPAAYNDDDNLMNNGILAVGATDINNGLAQWANQCSNNRDWIDIFAPGQSIYTTDTGGGYSYQSGTSLATPIVSGAAALLWALKPSWTAQMVHDELVGRATVLSTTDGTTSDPRLDGKRLINVFAALGAPSDLTLEPPNPSVPENSAAGTEVATVKVVDVDVTDPTPGAPAETFSYSLEVVDDAGNLLAGCVPFQIDSSSGTITTVGAGCSLEFDAYTTKVRVKDSANLSFDKNFTIAVTHLTWITVENQWGGPSAPWQPGGEWKISERMAALDVKSSDGGQTLNGTITYAGEEPIGFKATLTQNNTYTVENQWGGPSAPWQPAGDWILGARTDQNVVAININSTDGGKTFTGDMTYAGEGPIGFRGTLIILI